MCISVATSNATSASMWQGISCSQGLHQTSLIRVYLGATNLYTLQLVELQGSLAEVQQVIAAVQESIQSPKECAVLELPWVQRSHIQGACLVVKIVALEGSQHPHSDTQLVNSLLAGFV